jgi:sulfide:quinone oxidoreductase
MRVQIHAVVWREGNGEIAAGPLTVAESYLRLGGPSADTGVSISADEVAAMRIGRDIEGRIRGRPALVLDRLLGPPVHVAAVSGFGLLHELEAHVQGWLGARHARCPLRVVVAGGGIAAAETMLALRHHAHGSVAITLLAPNATASYRPLGVVQPFGGAAEEFELDALARDCAAKMHLDGVASVDANARTLTTFRDEQLDYDALVVATGARADVAIKGALTFSGPSSAREFRMILEEVRAGAVRRLSFVVPAGMAWSLPAYELALLTAEHVREHGLTHVGLTLVTAEHEPLAVFGADASAALAARLDEAGVEVLARTRAVGATPGVLELASGATIAADRVVAIPRLVGPRIPGLPADAQGFIPTDPYGHVAGAQGVFAAGDAGTFPVKHGGLAAQQADTVALGIAALAGAAVRPEPFRPVLHGLVLAGGRPLFLRSQLVANGAATSAASEDALWWPPAKVVARHLAPYLAAQALARERQHA